MSQNGYLTLDQQSIEQRVGIYLVPKFLANAQPWLILETFADKIPLPKNKGDTWKAKRNVPFDVDSSSLIEGVTPPPQNFRQEIVTGQIREYGRYVNFSNKVEDLHEDAVVDGLAQELSKQASTTKEMIGWETVRAGTQVIYSGTATSRATVEDLINLRQLRAAVAVLQGNHGDFLTGRIAASTNYGTEAVAESYVAVTHTNMAGDIRDIDGFVPVEKYGSFKPLNKYELGKAENVRFVATPHFEPFYGAGSATTTGVRSRDGAAVDVYPTIIMAKGFWATTALSGMDSVEAKVVPSGNPTLTDPLGQRGFAMWKYYFTATRLNEDWGVRVESAASDWS